MEEQYSRDFCLDTAGLRLKVDFLDTSGSHQFPAMRNLAIQQGGEKINLDMHFGSSEKKISIRFCKHKLGALSMYCIGTFIRKCYVSAIGSFHLVKTVTKEKSLHII